MACVLFLGNRGLGRVGERCGTASWSAYPFLASGSVENIEESARALPLISTTTLHSSLDTVFGAGWRLYNRCSRVSTQRQQRPHGFAFSHIVEEANAFSDFLINNEPLVIGGLGRAICVVSEQKGEYVANPRHGRGL